MSSDYNGGGVHIQTYGGYKYGKHKDTHISTLKLCARYYRIMYLIRVSHIPAQTEHISKPLYKSAFL